MISDLLREDAHVEGWDKCMPGEKTWSNHRFEGFVN